MPNPIKNSYVNFAKPSIWVTQSWPQALLHLAVFADSGTSLLPYRSTQDTGKSQANNSFKDNWNIQVTFVEIQNCNPPAQ